jgi:hypothetical protein
MMDVVVSISGFSLIYSDPESILIVRSSTDLTYRFLLSSWIYVLNITV